MFTSFSPTPILLGMLSAIAQSACQPGKKNSGSSPHEGVQVSGAMRNVMMSGDLQSTIYLDTLPDKINLYGVGPADSLSGEILVVGGKSYVSRLVNDTSMRVEETFQVGAPFFVYAHINDWQEAGFPDSVRTLAQLESYLNESAGDTAQPFVFRLLGQVKKASIHVVNLPKGTIVRSREDAHLGKRTFLLRNEDVQIIGFYSQKHMGIFTHHDSNIHMHLITNDRKWMGHIDGLDLQCPVELYVGKMVLQN